MIYLRPIIQAYISREDIYHLERYKWQAIKCFQKHFFEKGLPLEKRLELAFTDSSNLLTSRNYFPKGMLVIFAKEKEKDTQNAINLLFDSSQDLKSRVSSFMEQTESIFRTMQKEGYGDWKERTNVQSYQDTHAISTYLSMRFPNEFYIYKWTIFKKAATILGFEIKSRDKIDKLIEYQEFCEIVKQEILKEKEYLAEYRKRLVIDEFFDDNYNILTQDFIYAVAVHINADYFKNKNKRLARDEQTITSSMFKSIVPQMTQKFRGRKGIDYSIRDKLNQELGSKGELWAINYERERLSKQGITFEIRHVSVLDGDGLGYDILSVEDDNVTPRYIEVKTTTGGIEQPFFFTNSELEFSKTNKDHFYLYRLYNFKRIDQQANVLIIKGSLEELKATPVNYKALIDSEKSI